MDKNKLGIIFVVLGIGIIFLAIIINIFPNSPSEREQKDIELNNEQLKRLVKEMTKYLTSSDDITSSTYFSEDEMIQFTFSYINTLNLDETLKIEEQNSTGIVNYTKVKEYVEYIFGVKQLNGDNISFDIKDGNIYIPLNLQGGDAQTYKYRETTFDSSKGESIAYIDCLEITDGKQASNLISKSKYNFDDVIFTLEIKYKVIGNRKILLAYSVKPNY